MEKIEFSAIEKEMASFDLASLQAQVDASSKSIQTATSANDVIQQICDVWRRIRKYVLLAENLPFVGKFIKILATLLDSLCG